MKNNYHIFKTPDELANKMAFQLMDWVYNHDENIYHLAISGGKTPELLFMTLASKYYSSTLWEKVHFWWVDERMVPATDPESNFGNAQKFLFSKISIPEKNIHRIKGENDPKQEALSYSTQIQKEISQANGWPSFDLILLGMGNDGHTASIFPDQLELLDSDQVCEVANHPSTAQKRVTLTGKAINNAQKVCFLVTGFGKAVPLSEIWINTEKANSLPAAHINPNGGELYWYVDEPAAQFLKERNPGSSE